MPMPTSCSPGSNRAGYAELDAGDWRGVLPIGGGLPAENFALAAFSSFAELLAEAGNEALNEAPITDGAPFPAPTRRRCPDGRVRSHLHRRAPGTPVFLRWSSAAPAVARSILHLLR